MSRWSWPLLILCAATGGDAAEPLMFSVMGDVPYTAGEDVLLARQLAELPAEAAFVVHLGDIKSGGSPCDEAVFVKVAGLLARSPRPLFIVPGDNEWNDCLQPENAWALWQRHFLKFDERWRHGLRVARQLSRGENFAFVHSDALFVGVNLVGGKVHNDAEWKARHAANLDWLKQQLAAHGSATHLVLFSHAKPIAVHADFITGFERLAGDFARPVLYLHGDGHQWIHDRPFAAKNVLRVQVDSGGLAPPISVTLSNDAQSPFQLDRRNGLLPTEGPAKKPAPAPQPSPR